METIDLRTPTLAPARSGAAGGPDLDAPSGAAAAFALLAAMACSVGLLAGVVLF